MPLIAHCGTRKITRAELESIQTPLGTRTHQPFSHYQIVELLIDSLAYRYLKVINDEYAVSPDGMRMFGILDLETQGQGFRFSVGVRNSNDKSMRLAMTVGFRVVVCDSAIRSTETVS